MWLQQKSDSDKSVKEVEPLIHRTPDESEEEKVSPFSSAQDIEKIAQEAEQEEAGDIGLNLSRFWERLTADTADAKTPRRRSEIEADLGGEKPKPESRKESKDDGTTDVRVVRVTPTGEKRETNPPVVVPGHSSQIPYTVQSLSKPVMSNAVTDTIVPDNTGITDDVSLSQTSMVIGCLSPADKSAKAQQLKQKGPLAGTIAYVSSGASVGNANNGQTYPPPSNTSMNASMKPSSSGVINELSMSSNGIVDDHTGSLSPLGKNKNIQAVGTNGSSSGSSGGNNTGNGSRNKSLDRLQQHKANMTNNNTLSNRVRDPEPITLSTRLLMTGLSFRGDGALKDGIQSSSPVHSPRNRMSEERIAISGQGEGRNMNTTPRATTGSNGPTSPNPLDSIKEKQEEATSREDLAKKKANQMNHNSMQPKSAIIKERNINEATKRNEQNNINRNISNEKGVLEEETVIMGSDPRNIPSPSPPISDRPSSVRSLNTVAGSIAANTQMNKNEKLLTKPDLLAGADESDVLHQKILQLNVRMSKMQERLASAVQEDQQHSQRVSNAKADGSSKPGGAKGRGTIQGGSAFRRKSKVELEILTSEISKELAAMEEEKRGLLRNLALHRSKSNSMRLSQASETSSNGRSTLGSPTNLGATVGVNLGMSAVGQSSTIFEVSQAMDKGLSVPKSKLDLSRADKSDPEKEHEALTIALMAIQNLRQENSLLRNENEQLKHSNLVLSNEKSDLSKQITDLQQEMAELNKEQSKELNTSVLDQSVVDQIALAEESLKEKHAQEKKEIYSSFEKDVTDLIEKWKATEEAHAQELSKKDDELALKDADVRRLRLEVQTLSNSNVGAIGEGLSINPLVPGIGENKGPPVRKKSPSSKGKDGGKDGKDGLKEIKTSQDSGISSMNLNKRSSLDQHPRGSLKNRVPASTKPAYRDANRRSVLDPNKTQNADGRVSDTRGSILSKRDSPNRDSSNLDGKLLKMLATPVQIPQTRASILRKGAVADSTANQVPQDSASGKKGFVVTPRRGSITPRDDSKNQFHHMTQNSKVSTSNPADSDINQFTTTATPVNPLTPRDVNLINYSDLPVTPRDDVVTPRDQQAPRTPPTPRRDQQQFETTLKNVPPQQPIVPKIPENQWDKVQSNFANGNNTAGNMGSPKPTDDEEEEQRSPIFLEGSPVNSKKKLDENQLDGNQKHADLQHAEAAVTLLDNLTTNFKTFMSKLGDVAPPVNTPPNWSPSDSNILNINSKNEGKNEALIPPYHGAGLPTGLPIIVTNNSPRLFNNETESPSSSPSKSPTEGLYPIKEASSQGNEISQNASNQVSKGMISSGSPPDSGNNSSSYGKTSPYCDKNSNPDDKNKGPYRDISAISLRDPRIQLQDQDAPPSSTVLQAAAQRLQTTYTLSEIEKKMRDFGIPIGNLFSPQSLEPLGGQMPATSPGCLSGLAAGVPQNQESQESREVPQSQQKQSRNLSNRVAVGRSATAPTGMTTQLMRMGAQNLPGTPRQNFRVVSSPRMLEKEKHWNIERGEIVAQLKKNTESKKSTERENRRLRQENDTLRAKVKNVKETMEQHNVEFEAKNTELVKKMEAVEAKKKYYRNVEHENERLLTVAEEQGKESLVAIGQLNHDIASMQNMLEDMIQVKNNLFHDIAIKENEIKDREKQIQDLKQSDLNLRKIIGDYEVENSKLCDEILQIKDKVTRIHEEKKKMEKDKKQITEAHETVTEEFERYKLEKEKEHSDLKNRNRKSEIWCRQTEEKIKTVEDRHNRIYAEKEELAKRFQDMLVWKEKMLNDNALVEKRYQENLILYKENETKFMQHISDLETQIKEMNNQMAYLNSCLRKTENEKVTTEQQKADVESQKKEVERTCEFLTRDRERIVAKLESMVTGENQVQPISVLPISAGIHFSTRNLGNVVSRSQSSVERHNVSEASMTLGGGLVAQNPPFVTQLHGIKPSPQATVLQQSTMPHSTVLQTTILPASVADGATGEAGVGQPKSSLLTEDYFQQGALAMAKAANSPDAPKRASPRNSPRNISSRLSPSGNLSRLSGGGMNNSSGGVEESVRVRQSPALASRQSEANAFAALTGQPGVSNAQTGPSVKSPRNPTGSSGLFKTPSSGKLGKSPSGTAFETFNNTKVLNDVQSQQAQPQQMQFQQNVHIQSGTKQQGHEHQGQKQPNVTTEEQFPEPQPQQLLQRPLILPTGGVGTPSILSRNVLVTHSPHGLVERKFLSPGTNTQVSSQNPTPQITPVLSPRNVIGGSVVNGGGVFVPPNRGLGNLNPTNPMGITTLGNVVPKSAVQFYNPYTGGQVQNTVQPQRLQQPEEDAPATNPENMPTSRNPPNTVLTITPGGTNVRNPIAKPEDDYHVREKAAN